MTFSSSAVEAPPSAGLGIVVTDAAPARLPGEGPRAGAPAHRLVARDSGEYLFVGLRGGRGTASLSGPSGPSRDVLLGPGDICFYDVHAPAALDFPDRFRMKVFLVARESLGLEEADVRRVTRAPVARASRMGTLLSPFLSDFAETAGTASGPPVGEMLAWNVVNLLATLATEQLGGADEAGTPGARSRARSPLVARIVDFVDRHLTDADLSPETIAAAHHISVRYLHKLFKDEGTTVGRWIQRRRLEECRRDLVLRGRGNRTIAAVAGRWGFMSATHFSRVFRAAYGMSPSEWRDTAGRAGHR